MYKGESTWKTVAVFCGLLLSCSLVGGQTAPTQTTTPPVKLTPAEKRANAKAAAEARATQAKAAKATPAAATPVTSTPARATPAATPVTSAPAAATATATSALPSRTPATAASALSSNGLPSRSAGTSATQPATSSSGTSRSALTTQGLGSFQGADYTITAYGCYRSANSVLCDFDLTKAHPAQMGVQPFNNIVIVDDGGKINHRGNAYYMGTDGAHMESAYLSTTPVRYVMEFDGVGQQASSVSLVRAANRIDNVPVKAAAAAQ